MTATSPRAKRRLFPAAGIAGQEPLDPMYALDAIANNLLHMADEAHAKVLVCDIAADDSLITGGGNAPEFLEVTTGGNDEWITVAVYGPFDLSTYLVGGARTPYKIRPMIYAPSASVTFAIQLCLPDETGSLTAAAVDLGTGVDAVEFTSTGSESPQWLALSAGDTITPSQSLVDAAMTRFATLDGPAGSATSVVVSGVCARVLAKGTTTASLHGVVLAEYLSL